MTVTTGIQTLDRMFIDGLPPRSLTLYAGFSQSGMTTLLDTTVCATALHGRTPTLLIDLESPQRGHRLLSTYTGVPLLAIQRDTMDVGQEADVAAAKRELAGVSLTVATPRTAEDVRGQARTAGAELVAIDGARYLDLNAGDDNDPAAWLVTLGQLRTLARDQHRAIVVTHPLNRFEVSGSPSLQHLPAGVEQMFDVIVFIDRLTLDGRFSDTDTVELVVAKNRFGMTGPVEVLGDYARARFLDANLNDAQAA